MPIFVCYAQTFTPICFVFDRNDVVETITPMSLGYGEQCARKMLTTELLSHSSESQNFFKEGELNIFCWGSPAAGC